MLLNMMSNVLAPLVTLLVLLSELCNSDVCGSDVALVHAVVNS